MFRKIFATLSIAALTVLGLGSPAYAQDYDYEVTASAVASNVNIPSTITWTIHVASVGDDMGQFGEQSGTVEFEVPDSISVVVSQDCDVDGNYVTCEWIVSDDTDAEFDVIGFVSLTALGNITVTPAFVENGPRTDSNSANDSATATCTAVTSLLVTC